MPVLPTQLDANAPVFEANAAAMKALVAQLKDRTAEAALGGSEAAREKHLKRGKLLSRDRVQRLLDPGSAFLELSPLAANGLYEGDVHGAGMITGIGRVSGREVMIVCNDATVKGGTYYPMTVKKHLRAQEIARENRCRASIWWIPAAPTCPTRPKSFPDRDHFGRIFYNQANLSAEGIPQIAVVMGSCTAGGCLCAGHE
jgi:3-methylcrotonyl-CoA carboxylase beta subunit